MPEASSLARWRPHLPHQAELATAAFAGSASLAPSLLPKTVLVQGVVTGMAAVAGYCLGTTLHWLLAPVRRRLRPSTRARINLALLGAAVIWLVAAMWLGQVWQSEIASSIGQTDPPPTNAVAAVLIALAILTASVSVGRAVRMAIRLTARRLTGSLPNWMAVALAVWAVLGMTGTLTYQIIQNRVLDSVDNSFRLINAKASAEASAPTNGLRSGGPGSLTPWSTLGRAGREFVTLPDPPEGQRPVRVYAGIDSAPELRERANLVLAELERTGGLRRAIVCVVIPTGTGWVDQDAVTALERQWAGDSAVISMQYSYLPSVLSLVIDRLRVDRAATALLGAVVDRWLSLPEKSRPRLVLYGESLGSRGVEVAMRAVPGARAVVNGILLAGPMNSNPTWSEQVARRDPGTPLLAPIVDNGRSVRFWPGEEMPEYDRTRDPWPAPADGPRVLYLQHPSDPIVWWSPTLLWSKPSWVDERSTVGDAPPLRWGPLVTFWQISGDAVFSNAVPRGHGHRYGCELSTAWAAVAPRTDPDA